MKTFMSVCPDCGKPLNPARKCPVCEAAEKGSWLENIDQRNRNMVTIIATENVNQEAIKDVLDGHLQGYTLLEGHGFWQGTHERCLWIVVAGELDQDIVAQVCARIKIMNDQQSIMVLTLNAGVEFV